MESTKPGIHQNQDVLPHETAANIIDSVYSSIHKELEASVYAALETYSNVHRGSGHFSLVSTELYERARELVLDYLGLSQNSYTVIFCTARRAAALISKLSPGDFQVVSSGDIRLSLGVWAMAVRKKALPRGIPFQTGGGTTRLVSTKWVIWARHPERLEAGTPAIINVITFVMALRLIQLHGRDVFNEPFTKKISSKELIYDDELQEYRGEQLLSKLRKSGAGLGVEVPTTKGRKAFINMDNAASTPTFKPVWKAYKQSWQLKKEEQDHIANETRAIIAGLLDAPPDAYEVIFTSNTTEAINLAAENTSKENHEDEEVVILLSMLEHSSNDLPWRYIPGASVIRLSIDKEGFIDIREFENRLQEYNQEKRHGKKRIKMISLTGASNVLGSYSDLEAICRIAHAYGVKILVDAAQLIAHRKINMQALGIDYLAFSGHKTYAPFGTGVLVVKKNLLKFSITEKDLIRSSGEENAAGIAALGKALLLLERIGMDVIQKAETGLTRKALGAMARISRIKLYGVNTLDSPNLSQKGGVISFDLKGVLPNKVAKRLALEGGIGVRYGCHCAHVLIKHLVGVGPKLERFQALIVTLFPRLELPGMVRVSFGIENTEEEVDKLLQCLKEISENKKETNAQSKPSKKQMKKFIAERTRKVFS